MSAAAVFSFSRVSWVVGVCLLSGIAGGVYNVAQAQTLEAQPVFDVGDKWTYRFHNIGDRKEPYMYTQQAYKSEGGVGWLYVEINNNESPRKQAIYRYDYKRADAKERFEFKAKKPRETGRRYFNSQPQDDWIQFPLVVGKKYNLTFEWNNGEGNTKYDVEVENFQKVTTPAGEFDAFRIKASGWWMRTSNGSGSGRAETVVYYAPAVKRYVKWEFTDRTPGGMQWNSQITELVKWEPKASLSAIFESKAAAPDSVASAPVVPVSQ